MLQRSGINNNQCHFKLILSLATLFFLVCSFIIPAGLHAQTVQYDSLTIERIDIIMMGNADATDTTAIRARIKSREGEFFSQSDFDTDLKRLASDFDRLDPTVECQDGKLYITIRIWPKATIRTITWGGNCKVKANKLVNELGIHPGCVFDRGAFNQAFHKLKAYYVGKGFFEAQLSYDVILDPNTNEVDIFVTIEEGRTGRIRKLVFVNFTPQEEEELRELLLTRRYNLLLSWMTEEGTYREEMIQQDELTIHNYLQDRGYADARVLIDVTETCQSNRIIVTITVERGDLYRVGSISIKGNTLFCEEEIRRRFCFREGSPYSPELIRLTIDRITGLYGKQGYIDAVVDYEPRLCPDSCAYDLEFTIEEGTQYRLGLIRVFGNCWTQPEVILHETQFTPGEIFNMEKLKRTEERLFNTQFFKNVNVYPVRSEGSSCLGDNYRDINIEVEEASTGHFGAFFGFSTSEDLFGGFNMTEDNFNSAGIPCLWHNGIRSLRGGGEHLNFTATIGTQSRSYVLSWSKPYFMDSVWTVGFDFEKTSNRIVSKDYDINSTGFTLKGMRAINQFVRFGLHYRITNSDVDITSHLRHKESELEREERHSDLSSSGEEDLKGILRLEEEARDSGLLSAVGCDWVYDSTNSPVRPTRGWKSKIAFEYAGLGGAHTFLSVAYLNSYFLQFPDIKGVFKLRADVRFIQPLWGTEAGDVPLGERYFMGGEYFLRGYRPYRVGPRYDDDDPRGGISLQFLSMEYSRFFIKRAEWFVFADAGHLSMHQWNIDVPQVALGAGIKIYVFEGTPPLMIGMGFPLNPKDSSEVKRFFLTVGGRF